jgi:hypothetical protein
MVSATPEPAENSAGVALVPALWEISARAALHARPQGAAARNCDLLQWPVAPRDRTLYASDGQTTRPAISTYTIARAPAVMAVTV